ncbi:hypothetical protein SAMN05444395_11255 [Flavobacterium fryxellicola]|uniref:Uncharacterized protein n=1 Tax=Flavobacterium fryxellicola TaxID=249352 RepID=A0A167XBW3_9FLAO|nr:hypothetical protein [Flavobacterium fryxellicola]OAB28202.1 hypothetical protein FBFR_10200 [Flavobacterium fryxellicola]SHN78085.1 hypothetical protein SAMN05444395_11255 [Flavobacterium fryxellicola]
MTLYNKTLTDFNNNFIGFATLIVIGQSCLGSVAAMNILRNGTSLIQMFQLGLIILICMLVNTSILAQMKHKVIFNFTIISVILSISLIFINKIII